MKTFALSCFMASLFLASCSDTQIQVKQLSSTQPASSESHNHSSESAGGRVPPAFAGAGNERMTASGESGEIKGLTGEIRLGKRAKVKPGMSFFLSARPVAGGPPLAVKRPPMPEFPYRFSLTSADSMMQGTSFAGEVEVTARLDQDGDALTRQPGDFFGQVKTHVGEKGVKLVIDQEIKK